MSKTLLTLDFETYYDTKLSLRRMSTMEYVRDDAFKVWGVGLQINDNSAYWVGENEVADALDEIDWENTSLLCHNTPFDGYVLTYRYKHTPAYYFDTSAMSRGWWPGLSSSLKVVAERCFPNDVNMRKGDELVTAKGIVDLPPDVEEDIAGYCIQDVTLTYSIYNELINDYPKSELDLIHMTTKMFCEPVLRIDRDRLSKYHNNEIDKAKTVIEKSKYSGEILRSNPKFSAALKNDFKIDVPTKISPNTGLSIPALGKNDPGWRQMCKMYPQHQNIWDARIAAKSRIDETRAARFLAAADPDDNSLPSALRYYAAHTGRFGGTEKLNLQNLPRDSELRRCLVAPPGNYLYVADLSNIEARMLAWLAGQNDLLKQFETGEDIYSNFASTIYNRPIDKTNDPTERFVGKTAILGLGYGMGGKKFQDTLKSGSAGPSIEFTESEAQTVVTKYRQTYFRIPLLWRRLENHLAVSLNNQQKLPFSVLIFDNGKILLPNGMSLKYQDLTIQNGELRYFGKNGFETTYGGRITENIIQALSRIVITDAMLKLETAIKNSTVALTIHDEIILSAPSLHADATMKAMIELLCIPPKWASDLPLDAEGGYAINYSK